MTNRTFLIGAIILLMTIGAMAQSGGQFAIEQSAIAGGGRQSTGGQFAIDGTSGQTVAGQRTTNAPFSLHAGFWNPDQFAPTVPEVTVIGFVWTALGHGIRTTTVTMTNANGETRKVISGTSGYFQFTNVPTGETYVFSVISNRFTFVEPTLVRTILENPDDIIFVANGTL
jgi:hypothetical protein